MKKTKLFHKICLYAADSGRMDVFMNSCELVSLVTAVSCAISKCAPQEDIPIIASILGQISATLTTIRIQEEANKPPTEIPEVPPDTELLT